MEAADDPARRAFLGALVVGGVAGSALTTRREEAAPWAPQMVGVDRLAVGDMIPGPGGAVVRVHSLTALPSTNIRIRYTNPLTDGGEELALDTDRDNQGFPQGTNLIVFARGVPQTAVRVGAGRSPGQPDVVDGGKP